MDGALAERWKSYQATIEDALSSSVSTDESEPTSLQQAMRYSVMAGGKRLRPVLVLMANEACGGQLEQALPAACAIEMIHTYSLIHDDLPSMDNDDFRRGNPTNHKVFGEAMAILAGDALLTRAFELLATRLPATQAALCCADLAIAAGAPGMVGGQVLDIESENQTDITEADLKLAHLQNIHRCKTGALIACAAGLGARTASANNQTYESLQSYGHHIGLAFQITDDLLDVTGDQEKMGKCVQKDADRGKLTFPGLLGIDESRRRAEETVNAAIRALEPLQHRGQLLAQLARFILERDH